jgi:hypothetical protein
MFRKSFLSRVTEILESFFSNLDAKKIRRVISDIQLPSTQNSTYSTNLKEEIKLVDLGKRYSILILELTSRMFENTTMMGELGIHKTNDSVKELHILNYYFIVKSIISKRLEKEIKKALISCIMGSYIDYLLVCHRDIKHEKEEVVYSELGDLQSLIQDRLKTYDTVYKLLLAENNDSSMIEGGEILLTTLRGILNPNMQANNVFHLMPLIMMFIDYHIEASKFIDIHKYKITGISKRDQLQDHFGNEWEISEEEDGKFKLKKV